MREMAKYEDIIIIAKVWSPNCVDEQKATFCFSYKVLTSLSQAKQPWRRITWICLGKYRLNAYLHQIGKHADGLCQSCCKPETVSHFLTECPHNETCSAVLAACNDLKPSHTLDIVLSDSRLHCSALHVHDAIISSLSLV